MTYKPTYEALEAQITGLKTELERYKVKDIIDSDLSNDIDFNDLFNLDEIQKIQDLFAEATGVASIITDTNGIPITKPSNFCRLCIDIIRNTEKGLQNCYHSDAVIGQQNKENAIYQPCLSGGLWDAGASITVGGKHIANWLIGQIKNEAIDESKMLDYAKEIGADEKEFKKALDEVSIMPIEKFKKIADTLYLFANEISNKAYQNILQNRLITELQKKEELYTIAKNRAEKNEQHNKMLFEILPIGLALTKMTGELVSMNKAYTDIIGYTEKEALSLSYWDITPEKYTEQEQQQLDSLHKIGFYGPYEKEYRNKSGELIPVRLIGRIVTINDEKFIWSSIENISENKKNEQDLLQAKEKAEESDRLKTAFLQNMSHEIRTPLNAISGFAGFLDMPDLSNEKRKSFVSIIQNSSEQLISIVTDILTISSLETNQEKLIIEKVCINDIIVDLLTIFKQSALNQNITLFTRQPLNNKQSEIYTDKAKITQIITNLLTNALKFTHEGYIEFGYKLKKEQDLAEIEFYVRDSGIGIEPELHEKIFERFRQAEMSINRRYRGTGLGLTISRCFSELLGGRIWVESILGKGSTFYFTIPYKPVNDKTIRPLIKHNSNHKTVIIAEDEEYNYQFIEELLHTMDLTLIHVKDGLETIELCKSNPTIILILMDIKMPKMDGHEAAKIIKELHPNIPIIAQSAYALEHERARYQGVFDDYITKPINADILKQKVIKFIDI